MSEETNSSPSASAGNFRVLRSVFIAVLGAIIAVGLFLYLSRDPARDMWNESRRLLNRGNDAAAHELLKAITQKYPSSPYADYAKAILQPEMPAAAPDKPLAEYDPSREVELPPDERLYREAQSFFPKGAKTRSDLFEASKRYTALVDSYPASSLAGDALYYSARCLENIGTLEDQIGAWKRLVTSYPNHGQAAEAMYALGYIHSYEMGRKEIGEKYFRELIKRFPESNSAEAARHSLGIGREIDMPEGEASSAKSSGAPSIITNPGGM